MNELFDEEDEFVETDEIILDGRGHAYADTRQRLENFLEEKRLRDELEDFMDY